MFEIVPISKLELPELMIYQERTESQLMHFFEPEPGIFIAETELVLERALRAGYEPVSMLVEDGKREKLLQRMDDWGRIRGNGGGNGEGQPTGEPSLRIYTGSKELLKNIAGFPLTRGVLCAMRRRELPSPGQLCRGCRRIAVLADVENPTNVGAIFRNAAALGIEAVVLTKGSADPLYRRAVRVSMGTVFQIPWTLTDTIAEIKALGFVVAGLALKEDSISLNNINAFGLEKLAVVLGNEANGISEELLQYCDYTVRIPMYNGVDSLNVAAASAIAFWELAAGED